VYGRARREGWLLSSASFAGTALIAGMLLTRVLRTRQRGARRDGPIRQLRQGAAILALSVLTDSALEHYRANFRRRPMYVAPSVGAATLVTSVRAARAASRSSPGQRSVFATAALTGLLGTGFHLRNLLTRPSALRRPGHSFSWLNLFYAAPLAAPLALTLSGLLGLAADSLARRSTAAKGSQRAASSAAVLLGAPAGRVLSMLTGIALLGNSAEVGLLHFRGAFQNPFMYVPVTIPPLAAAALVLRSAWGGSKSTLATRPLLRATFAVGMAGVGFHAYGIRRNMGGFGNLSQMILQGPPLPAPPAFTGLALAGLAACKLMERSS